MQERFQGGGLRASGVFGAQTGITRFLLCMQWNTHTTLHMPRSWREQAERRNGPGGAVELQRRSASQGKSQQRERIALFSHCNRAPTLSHPLTPRHTYLLAQGGKVGGQDGGGDAVFLMEEEVRECGQEIRGQHCAAAGSVRFFGRNGRVGGCMQPDARGGAQHKLCFLAGQGAPRRLRPPPAS